MWANLQFSAIFLTNSHPWYSVKNDDPKKFANFTRKPPVLKSLFWRISVSDCFCFVFCFLFFFHLQTKSLTGIFIRALLFRFQCVKSVSIRSFSGPYFLAFRLNRNWYRVSFRILLKRRKIRTRKLRIRAFSVSAQVSDFVYFFRLGTRWH